MLIPLANISPMGKPSAFAPYTPAKPRLRSLGLAGVYGAKADGFPIGDIFAKGISIQCGQALVQNYTDELLQLIQQGKLRSDDIITHRLALDEAMTGYEKFGRRIDNCLKVVMHP